MQTSASFRTANPPPVTVAVALTANSTPKVTTAAGDEALKTAGAAGFPEVGLYGAAPVPRAAAPAAYVATVVGGGGTASEADCNTNFTAIQTTLGAIRTALANIGVTL